MELVVGIPLFDFIVENKNNYNEEQARIIIKKILNGISYLHENHVCHRDLKPENIIIIPKENEYEFDIKLVDFGYAKDIEEESEGRNSPRIGTLGYKAPEIFKQQEYDKSVDMWALGVITYILLCGFPPFFSHSEYKTDLTLLRDAPFWFFFNNETKELEEQILSGKVDFPKPFWDIISEKAKNFVCLLLEVNPKKRMTVKKS
jgi:serine/threonine protein kinase